MSLLPPTAAKPAGTSIVEEFAKSNQVDATGDIEFSLLNDLVRAFGTNPVLARRAMRELLSRAPAKFYGSALNILKSGQAGPGADYLNSLLLENDLLLAALADPHAFQLSSAVALAKNLYRMDPQLDARLLKQVLKDDASDRDKYDPLALERVLEIVDEVSDGRRLVPILMKLQKHPDNRIRSKVALLLVRAHRNADWLAQQLASDDARIRANAIEGLLYATPGEKEVNLLWEAAQDQHHRVASTALLVLAKMGHRKASEQLSLMAGSASELTRAAAAWAMGMSGDSLYLEVLQKMVRSDVGAAKRMALKSSVLLRKTIAASPPAAAQQEAAPSTGDAGEQEIV
ncbi:MAG: HEAT repeat domain-containing protein [Bryobacterales bacterium]|nr:HEAT repeat domain-containing protein [Bryobacterales bacterium]